MRLSMRLPKANKTCQVYCYYFFGNINIKWISMQKMVCSVIVFKYHGYVIYLIAKGE